MTPAQLSALVVTHRRALGVASSDPEPGTAADLMMFASMKRS